MRLYKVERMVWNNLEEETEQETTFVVADDVEGVLDELDDPYTQEILAVVTVSNNVRVQD